MSKKLERAALKTAATIKGQAIQHGWSNLIQTCKLMGLSVAFLASASPLAAQTLALTESKGTQGTFLPSVKETPHQPIKRELRGITGEEYQRRNGEVVPVWLAPDGRKFVYRPNGRKFFPKSLNK